MSFAIDPPKVGSCIVDQLWDRLLSNRREDAGSTTADTSVSQPNIHEKINEMLDTPSLNLDETDFDHSGLSQAVLKRSARRGEGAWYQVPKAIENRKVRQ